MRRACVWRASPLPANDIDRALVRDRLALAVREAGALALQMFRGQLASWIKGASSPVSEADLAVDALLRERLMAIRDAGWLSEETEDRKSTRLNSSHVRISYAVFCLKKKKQ